MESRNEFTEQFHENAEILVIVSGAVLRLRSHKVIL